MIYTIGYNNTTINNFKKKIEELDAIIFDIRLVPFSNMLKWWDGEELKKTFGEKYIHCKELGNKNYNSNKPIEILDIRGGIELVKSFVDKNKDVVLLCVCSRYDKCHRKVVSDEIFLELDIETQELDC